MYYRSVGDAKELFYVLSPNFYKYMVKKNLINDGQMKFRSYPIELDSDEYADIWGMTGKTNDKKEETI